MFYFYFNYNLVYNFLNTGCFIYPASITCIDNLNWSIGKIETNLMNDIIIYGPKQAKHQVLIPMIQNYI